MSDNRSETEEKIEAIKSEEEEEDEDEKKEKKEKVQENHKIDAKKFDEEKNKNRSQIMLRGLGIEEIKEIQNEESSECRSQNDEKKPDNNDKINIDNFKEKFKKEIEAKYERERKEIEGL